MALVDFIGFGKQFHFELTTTGQMGDGAACVATTCLPPYRDSRSQLMAAHYDLLCERLHKYL